MQSDSTSGELDFKAVVETLVMPVMPGANAECLIIGDSIPGLLDYLESHQTAPSFSHFTAQQILNSLSGLPSRTDILVVSNFKGGESGRSVVIRLIGLLRDNSSSRVLHLVLNNPRHPAWTISDSLAMGFIKVGDVCTEAVNYSLYEFDIKSYKSDPDWLNAKNWAHPHLWKLKPD